MRTIEGIVCTARFRNPRYELLFGPRRNKLVTYSHENFQTNGLTPYEDLVTAQEALTILRVERRGTGIANTGLAEIKIVVFTDDEMESLPERGNYIVVAELDYGMYMLLGKMVESAPRIGHLPGSELVANRFQVKRTLRWTGIKTFGLLYEVRRQSRPVSSNLATFEMKRVR